MVFASSTTSNGVCHHCHYFVGMVGYGCDEGRRMLDCLGWVVAIRQQEREESNSAVCLSDRGNLQGVARFDQEWTKFRWERGGV